MAPAPDTAAFAHLSRTPRDRFQSLDLGRACAALCHDIVANERIVHAYEMHLDDRKISVSLATMQLRADGAQRTTLLVTEQGAFLDGYDDAGAREQGTGVLLDRLGASLQN